MVGIATFRLSIHAFTSKLDAFCKPCMFHAFPGGLWNLVEVLQDSYDQTINHVPASPPRHVFVYFAHFVIVVILSWLKSILKQLNKAWGNKSKSLHLHCHFHTHFWIPLEDLVVIVHGATNFGSLLVLHHKSPPTAAANAAAC